MSTSSATQQQQQQQPPSQQDVILSKLSSGIATAQKWEDDVELLIRARSFIPLDELMPTPPSSSSSSSPSFVNNATADALASSKYAKPDDSKYYTPTTSSNNSNNNDALLLKRVTLWFQKEFMTWCNAPDCTFCGAKGSDDKIKSIGMRGAQTDEERDGMASRVEVYNCSECNAEITFPRYNSPSKLLETRKGRCGEYANLFGLICRSLGYEVRYVVDLTDHVWVEVWSHQLDRWIMADSCEGKIDAPGMYEHGWNKKLSHIFAYNSGCRDGPPTITDVTKRYTRAYTTPEFIERRKKFCSGGNLMLDMLLQQMNTSLSQRYNKKISKGRMEELTRRQELEMDWLTNISQKVSWKDGDGGVSPDESEGRISGSYDWKASRDELGSGSGGKKMNEERNNGDGGSSSSSSSSKKKKEKERNSYMVESFLPHHPSTSQHITITTTSIPPPPPSSSNGKKNKILLLPDPTTIIVSGVPCAVGSKGINIVIVDETNGCILQTSCFATWVEAGMFIDDIPDGRIIALSTISGISGSAGGEKETTTTTAQEEAPPKEFHRVGGFHFPEVGKKKSSPVVVAFVGQVGYHPIWAQVGTVGIHVTLELTNKDGSQQQQQQPLKLKREKNILPQTVSGRIPEYIMPLGTQVLASNEQKRIAVDSFMKGDNNNNHGNYTGYVTKVGHPIYLLTKSSFPFIVQDVNSNDKSSSGGGGGGGGWTTYHLLPEPLVPPNQEEEEEESSSTSDGLGGGIPVEAPTNLEFFTSMLGPNLLTKNGSTTGQIQDIPLSSALDGKRFIGLYFSAHWCPPCKGFTPMLARFYEIARRSSSLDLEIVFVSSDRDATSFRNYYGSSMPFLSMPFEERARKEMLSMRFGIRGIPSLIIFDSISGTVVSQETARNEIMMSIRRGNDDAITDIVKGWIAWSPEESKAIMDSIRMSLEESMKSTSTAGEDAGGAGGSGSGNVSEQAMSYLIRDKKVNEHGSKGDQQPTVVDDTSERVKVHFTALVTSGKDPTSAAAEAIRLVAEEKKKKTHHHLRGGAVASRAPSLECGPLGGNNNAWMTSQAFDPIVVVAVPSSSSNNDEVCGVTQRFSDPAVAVRKLTGVKILRSSSSSLSSPYIVGIQSLYEGTNTTSTAHRVQSSSTGGISEGEWTVIPIRREEDSTTRVLRVTGVMGKSGLKTLDLVTCSTALPSTENGGTSSYCELEEGEVTFDLDVADGYELCGFHGTLSSMGIASLGIICTKGTIPNNSAVMAAVSKKLLPCTISAANNLGSLSESDKSGMKLVLTTAKKYLDNAMKEPFNSKFRTFKLNNKVSDRICQTPGGLDLVSELGFVVYPPVVASSSGEFMVSLPLALDLELTHRRIGDLLEHYTTEA